MAIYYVLLDGTDNTYITGTSDTPQTIKFEDLKDIEGNQLPTGGFSSIPFMIIKRLPENQRDAVITNITKTQFQVYMMDYGDLSITQGKYLLIIKD